MHMRPAPTGQIVQGPSAQFPLIFSGLASRLGPSGAARPARPDRSDSAAEPQSKILVVDDEAGLRDMLAYELSQEGFEVTTAADGNTAVRLLLQHRFEAVVTDLKMPGMDGIETLSALKAIDSNLEVIVATGY